MVISDLEKKIEKSLAGESWTDWLESVDDLLILLHTSGALGEADALEWIDRFTEPSMKWEVKVRLAKLSYKLQKDHAARVFARLKDDPSFDVRLAVRKALRKVNQASFLKEKEPQNPAMADLALKLARVGIVDVERVVRYVEHASHRQATAELAHELKNIIQRILTPANQLSKALTAEQKKHVQVPLAGLRKGLKALTDYTEGFEWLAHGMNPEFVKTDLKEIVQNVTASVKAPKGISILTPSRQDLKMDVVPERLVRALANILRNAVEASPAEGIVVFDAFLIDSSDEVEFRITDSGPGIPKDERDYWFKIGKTGKRDEGHIGIGLYIARQVIEFEHEGTIIVEDAPKGGAVFHVRIPIKTKAKHHASTASKD